MSFKDFVWPHNPHSYEIAFRRAVAGDKIPFEHYYLQDLGLDYRVLRGEGEFCGEGAYDDFKRLATVFYSPGPGLLTHPVWQPAQAHFVALELTQEPRADYVAYRFEFWEDTGRHAPGLYEVEAGESSSGAAAGSAGSGSGSSSSSSNSNSSAASASSSAAGSAKTHVVRDGETLVSIAAAEGVSTAAIVRANPTVRPIGGIASGVVLRIE